MDALTGIENFVQQMNSTLAQIPRVITVNVGGVVPSVPGGSGASVAPSGGIDAEALAAHLFPHISDRLDERDRLRSTR